MIVVCIGQGLGNQMFQYAFYLAVRETYKEQEVLLDLDNMLGKAHNGFELDRIFGIQAKSINPWKFIFHANRYPKSMPASMVFRLLWRFRRLMLGEKETHIRYSDGTEFHPELFELPDHKVTILEGFWTNEKYFRKVRKEVLDSFQFRNKLDKRNQEFLDLIQHSNSVSIHVRHGDYKDSGFYILPLEYYRNAVEIIQNSVKNPKYFIFSDDPDYVKTTFTFLPNICIVEGNQGAKSYIDMQLMSNCRHNIIANSSFSFWGAYLNDNPGKIVIAANKISPYNKGGFYCDGWNVIDIF